jgi:hypothetical protein
MLTTRDFQHISLGKEGVPSVTRFMLCALTQKDRSIHESRTPKCAARINRPEVNQTKPEHSAHAEDLCR